MSEETAIRESGGEVVVYESPDGDVHVEVLVGDAYGEGELEEGATAKDSFVVRSEGGRQVRRRVQHEC